MGGWMHVWRWLIPFFQGLFVGVIAMTLHEVGHLVAAPLAGIKVRTVGFGWKGLYTLREPGPPVKNIIVSLAGPFTNLLLLAFWHLSPKLGLANLCFAFFNILPIEGSDGERIWSCWRQIKREGAAARSGSDTAPQRGAASDKGRPPAREFSDSEHVTVGSRSERSA
jgi:Zn-dependent protease